MKQSQGRIFTTHTGSLPRPDELVQLLAAVARGESVDQSALERLADESTLDVIRKQGAAGIDVVNSGEQSRVSFSTYVTQRMSGFGGSWTRRGLKDQNEFPGIARPRAVQLMRDMPQCTGPLEYQRPDLGSRVCTRPERFLCRPRSRGLPAHAVGRVSGAWLLAQSP